MIDSEENGESPTESEADAGTGSRPDPATEPPTRPANHLADSDAARRWRTLSSEFEGDYGLFLMRRERAEAEGTGEEHEFIVLDAPDWVGVCALTADDELVMVRQHRYGADEVTLELPGGLVEPGQSPREAAERELREETGYGGGSWRLLAKVIVAPELFTNHLHVYVVTGARPVAEIQDLDRAEHIGVELVPREEVRDLVRRGTVSHSQVLAALYLLELGF